MVTSRNRVPVRKHKLLWQTVTVKWRMWRAAFRWVIHCKEDVCLGYKSDLPSRAHFTIVDNALIVDQMLHKYRDLLQNSSQPHLCELHLSSKDCEHRHESGMDRETYIGQPCMALYSLSRSKWNVCPWIRQRCI